MEPELCILHSNYCIRGVGGRFSDAGYYDRSGALRDMIQNHVMQLLALTAMEPPSSLDPEAIRDEKVKALQAIKPLHLDGSLQEVIRGVYGEGLVGGEKAIGYHEEADIPSSSSTETYAALCLQLDNWRWKGVPFYIRSGKRLKQKISEIVVQFTRPPAILFGQKSQQPLSPNLLTIRIQPNEGVSLSLNSKTPGLETKLQPVNLSFGYDTTFGSNTPEAYERLILDSMVGDGTLFIRGDEAEQSWGLLSPVIDSWQNMGQEGLEKYAAGTWGLLRQIKCCLIGVMNGLPINNETALYFSNLFIFRGHVIGLWGNPAKKEVMSEDNLKKTEVIYEYAILGGGCFWCTEAVFESIDGVVEVISGYAGGKSPNPTYKEICSGDSGHAGIKIKFLPKEITFSEILDIFGKVHNPTTSNRQGADV